MLSPTEILKGIVFEENPFVDEIPDEVISYDLKGNVVSHNEAE